jgi:thiamine-phosphate pyrophosphorylase
VNPRLLRYAITDRALFSGDESNRRAGLLQQAARLATGAGVDFLQLREKDLPAADLATLATSLLQILGGSPTRLLINGRADIAVAVAAHGVHLTSTPGELTPSQVRALYAAAGLPYPSITVSCHTLDEVRRTAAASPDALLFGPVFAKSVAGQHITDGIGLALLSQACAAATPIPVLALGGITPANIASCLQAGAAGIAGIRLFLEDF